MRRCLLLGILWVCCAAAVRGDASGATASTAPADSAQTSTPAPADAPTPAVADTARLRPDPAWAWWRWPPVHAAIAIAPLDGPQDILAKEEILADRIDALVIEAARLDTLAAAWQARSVAMTAQLEVLEDLADVQLGGDLEFQQRTGSVREEVVQAAEQITTFAATRTALAEELIRLRSLSETYRQQAAQLREEEESSR
ncbi:MAG: hypothetical protein O2782_18400 [bacterium]|nr:hypothetical protein [bacterium]